MLFFGLFMLMQYHDERQEDEETLNTLMHVQAKAMATSLARPMKNHDYNQIHADAEALLAHPDVVGVRIFDLQNHPIEEAIDPEMQQEITPLIIREPIQYAKGDTVETIGEVALTISKQRLRERLWELAQSLLLAITFFLVLQMTTMFLVLRYL
ncbi:MAG: hypothetical protein B7Z49_03430, partial [Hydrogenophilales bacterium 12-63-5]